MEITEVRIKLMEESEDRLRGFCSITFDHCFVVRDLKIIQGNSGPFVAMPSRKLTGNCKKCGTKNHLRANYCNNCGEKLVNQQILYDSTGRAKLYADIAHPVNARCREMIQRRIVEELNREIELSAQPGYKSRYDDDYDEDYDLTDFSDPASLPLTAKTDSPTETSEKREDAAELPTPSPSSESHERHDSPQSETPGPHQPDPSQSTSDQGMDNDAGGASDDPKNFGKGIF